MELEDDATPGDDLPARPAAGIGTGAASRARAWVAWFGAGRLIAAALSVVAVVAGGVWLLREPRPPAEAQLPYAGASSTGSVVGGEGATTASAVALSTIGGSVTVHVAGAVDQPGVYTLPSGARVHTAIDAAGGARPRGDPGALNLAAPIVDGERVYVPLVGETIPVEVASAPIGSTPPVGPVDLNQATIVELDTLPGIGPTTAQAIIDHRTANGPFATVDDLEAVRGIGPAKLEAIRPLVQV